VQVSASHLFLLSLAARTRFFAVLAGRGASVAVADIRGQVAFQAADELQNTFGVKCVGIECDTARHDQVEIAVRSTAEVLGGLHCAVNAAGLPAYIGQGKFMGDYPVERLLLVTP